jgi:hypothetical protein
MRSISTFHSGNVVLTVSPRGIGAGGGLITDLVYSCEVVPASSIPPGVGCQSNWPCPEHATLAAHVFAQLYDLDYAVARAYEQKVLLL